MNYELTMLKNAVRMNTNAKILKKEIQRVALNSHNTSNWRKGTWGQIEAIFDYINQLDRLAIFCNSVKKALLLLPDGERALLVEVYFKNTDKCAIANKYNVSRATVFRRLFDARCRFRNALERIGCDEQWFADNYADFDWIVRRPYKK